MLIINVLDNKFCHKGEERFKLTYEYFQILDKHTENKDNQRLKSLL